MCVGVCSGVCDHVGVCLVSTCMYVCLLVYIMQEGERIRGGEE